VDTVGIDLVIESVQPSYNAASRRVTLSLRRPAVRRPRYATVLIGVRPVDGGWMNRNYIT